MNTDGARKTRTDTPRYYRISPRFWKDEKVMQWRDDDKLLALHLLTSLHRTPEGIFVLPISYLVADLAWRRRKIEHSMTVLIKGKFISFDSCTNVFLIRNALKYQVPENPNQTESVMRRINELPNSGLLQEFLELAKVHCYRTGTGSAAQVFYQRLEQVLTQRLAHSLTLTLPPTLTRNIQTLSLTPPAAEGGSDVISLSPGSEGEPEVSTGGMQPEEEPARLIDETTTNETDLPEHLRRVAPRTRPELDPIFRRRRA